MSDRALEQPAIPSRSWQGGSRVTQRLGVGQERSGPPLLTAGVRLPQHRAFRVGYGAGALLSLLVLWLPSGCGNGDSPISPAINRPPVIATQPDTSVAYGDTLRLSASASDPDQDALAFALAVIATWEEIRTGYSAHAGIDAPTGAFWFFPGQRDIPSRSFRITVEDGRGGADTTIFKVTVG